MREKWQKQMPLMAHIMNHPQSQELETISAIMDAKPTIYERILQDLNGGKDPVRRNGTNGMSAEQVLRCAIVKILFNFTYEELAFHIVDSHSLRWFCRTVRTDCTCVESHIHPPTDSSLLWDAVRVLTRLIERVRDEFGKVPGFLQPYPKGKAPHAGCHERQE